MEAVLMGIGMIISLLVFVGVCAGLIKVIDWYLS